MKAIKVTLKNRSEIVVANSDLFAFVQQICLTFGVSQIIGLKWLGCPVQETNFKALLNEQSLEFVVDIQEVDHINKQPLSQSSCSYTDPEPLCSSSFSFLTDLQSNEIFAEDIISKQRRLNDRFPVVLSHNGSTSSQINVTPLDITNQTAQCSRSPNISPNSNINISPNSNHLTKNLNPKRKMSKVKLPQSDVELLLTYFSVPVIELLNGVSNVFVLKELKNALTQFASLKVRANDNYGNREFFSRLKITLKNLYPQFKDDWEPMFVQISNNLRQQRWSKMHESSPKFFQLARGHNTLAIKEIVACAEPVLSTNEIEAEIKNELGKTIPSIAVLSILNRNLFYHQIFEQIPNRLRIAPSLLIDEFKRFFPQHENIVSCSRLFIKAAFKDNANIISSVMELQSMFISRKSKDFLFLQSHADNIDAELALPSLYGPQVVLNGLYFGIRSRTGIELCATQILCMEEVIASIIAVYYLKDLCYPSCFAQLLGIFQETILKINYPHKSKAAARYVLKFSSS